MFDLSLIQYEFELKSEDEVVEENWTYGLRSTLCIEFPLFESMQTRFIRYNSVNYLTLVMSSLPVYNSVIAVN